VKFQSTAQNAYLYVPIDKVKRYRYPVATIKRAGVVPAEVGERVKRMRVLRKQDLGDKLKIKPSTIDLMEAAGEFPRRIKLGRGRAVGWIEGEVDDWIAARAAARTSAA
jgi:prophage regulatory protein